jgi:hypothetical protein
MTAREKIEAEEKKQKIYVQRSGVCEVCGKLIKHSEAQLAHRIAKSKPNLRKYGEDVLSHPKNLALTCSDKFGRCNDSCNIGNNPGKVQELLSEIAEELL